MSLTNRDLAFWFLSRYCGEVILNIDKINPENKLETVCYDYLNKGCKSRFDYEFLVEYFRLFQKLPKDNWIIRELLK